MIILWIRKNKAEKFNVFDKNTNQSFQEHNDIMKKFRLAHPDLAVVSAKSILDGGNPLQPIQDVKLWENIQN